MLALHFLASSLLSDGPVPSNSVLKDVYQKSGGCPSHSSTIEDMAVAKELLKQELGCAVDPSTTMSTKMSRLEVDNTAPQWFMVNPDISVSTDPFPNAMNVQVTYKDLAVSLGANTWVRDLDHANGGGFFDLGKEGEIALVGMFPDSDAALVHQTLAMTQWVPFARGFGTQMYVWINNNTDYPNGEYTGFIHTCESWCNRVRYPHPTELNHTALTYSIYDAPVTLTNPTNILAHITNAVGHTLIVSHSGAAVPLNANLTLGQSNVLSHVLPLCWT